MAEMNDMMMRPWGGLSPYESFMISEKSSKRASGTAITGLVLGTVGTALGVGAWIFGPVISGQRSRGIEKLIDVTNTNTQATLDRMINALAAERTERVAQGVTMSQTITDSISGQQQGSQNQTTSVENSAMAAATTQLLTQSLLGNLSENAQKVQIYSAPSPCACPGCGCNG